MDELAPTVPTPFESISRVLAWLSKRAAPLTAILFAIASMLWSDFRHEFGLPIAFSSGSSLTALPAIAANVCAAIAIITGMLLTPAQILTVRLIPGGIRLADALSTPVDSETGQSAGRPKVAMMVERYWFTCAILSGLGWVVSIAWTSLDQSIGVGWTFLTVGLLAVIQTAGANPVLRTVIDGIGKVRWEFYGLLLSTHLLQSFVAFVAVYALLQTVHTSDVMELLLRGIYLFSALGIIALLQLMVALRVVRGWYANLPKHVVCFGIAVLGFVSLLQPIGARLASFALVSTATPLRLCTVLAFDAQASDPTVLPLRDGKSTQWSRPIRFVFPSDGMFYLQEKASSPTYIVDAKKVMATQGCVDEHLQH